MAQVELVKGPFGFRFCNPEGFIPRRVDEEELRGRWARIVCVDDERVIIETEDGNLYELEAVADCMYSDCSESEDPYGVLEIYRLYPR